MNGTIRLRKYVWLLLMTVGFLLPVFNSVSHNFDYLCFEIEESHFRDLEIKSFDNFSKERAELAIKNIESNRTLGLNFISNKCKKIVKKTFLDEILFGITYLANVNCVRITQTLTTGNQRRQAQPINRNPPQGSLASRIYASITFKNVLWMPFEVVANLWYAGTSFVRGAKYIFYDSSNLGIIGKKKKSDPVSSTPTKVKNVYFNYNGNNNDNKKDNKKDTNEENTLDDFPIIVRFPGYIIAGCWRFVANTFSYTWNLVSFTKKELKKSNNELNKYDCESSSSEESSDTENSVKDSAKSLKKHKKPKFNNKTNEDTFKSDFKNFNLESFFQQNPQKDDEVGFVMLSNEQKNDSNSRVFPNDHLQYDYSTKNNSSFNYIIIFLSIIIVFAMIFFVFLIYKSASIGV